MAAEIAVQELQRYISEAPGNEHLLDQVIQAAFKEANERVYAWKAHSGDPATEGIGGRRRFFCFACLRPGCQIGACRR